MHTPEENADRTSEPALTTQDLARPAPSGGGHASARPDEAVGEPAAYPDDTARESAAYPDGTAAGETASVPDEGARGPAVYPGEATRDEDYRPEDTGTGRAADGSPADGADGDGRPGAGREATTDSEPLLGAAQAEGYRTTWSEIQGRFVDDPREAVRSADTLVAEVMQAFAGTLSEHRNGLEKQWDRGEQVATEDLRLALQAYRSLINRLLNT
ncbi:hypothetical protein ACFWUW_12005 [Streptomyces sp. NPDC058655]|uniref:hypothetical protein n=1 Tax=unclassified Streptomyces TaxID=2593676 RepID=UPI00365588C1